MTQEPKRLILDNQSDLSMADFLALATEVVKRGRLSNNGRQYAYLVSFEIENNDKYHIVSDLNAKSDKLTLYKVLK